MPGWPFVDPLSLEFRNVHRHRFRALLSPFIAHDLHDPPPGTLVRLGSGPRAPYCAVVLDLAPGTAGGRVCCGLVGGGAAVLGHYDGTAGTVAIEVSGPGGTGRETAPAAQPPSALALVVNGNHATLLARSAGGDWRPALTLSDRVAAVVELGSAGQLAGLEYAYGSDAAAAPARVRAGYSGPVGVRDPQVVRRSDGRPFVRGGLLYLTLTSAGLGFFSQAHWSVWTLDLSDPRRLEQRGALFFARDGRVVGDHAGQLVVDPGTGRTTVLVSSWGDFSPDAGVHVRHLTTTEDLLSGVHVLESARLDVPSPHSVWDPSLARIGGRWHLAFTEGVSFGPPRFLFRPALAVSRGEHYAEGLTRVGADEPLEQCEGTILQRVGRRWYLLASDRDAAEYPLYDLSLRRLGRLRAPYGSNIPHPMVVPTGRRRPDPWWLVTFDGTAWHEEVLGYGTHGDLLVLAAAPVPLSTSMGGAAAALRRRAGAVRRRLPRPVR